MDKDLIIRIIIALHHVDFLLYCLIDLFYLLRITPYRNRILMDILDTTCRYIQALNIHLSTSEHSSYLIQNTRNIL